MATSAAAQSTGSIDFGNEIVVTGRSNQGVEGVKIPDTSNAKQVLTQDVIGRQNAGQTILDTVNLIPGVSFQNNDAYGSSGGTLTIRGFDSSRISLTFDGVPLNDSGNYAIYSNQQLDPELIEQVNVNLGTTDVDSPTASAVGGTVNYRTIVPTEEFGVRLSGSVGEDSFFRIFGLVNTGEFTPFGTRAFFSASTASNDNPFNNYGRVRKQQYNGRIYQPISDNGDFISVSGNYNENRNNFFGSVQLRNDRLVPSGFPQSTDERKYDINFPCTINLAATPGVADTPNGCGTEFDRRYNPSNTGNIRGASKFTINDSIAITIDPSFQYVKANGGGTTGGRERLSGGQAGYLGGRPYFGRDLNGDGDLLDEIRVLTPSQTRTRRYGVIAGVRWDINDTNTVRVTYTHDNANHRQTGQVGVLQANGEPFDVFPVNDGLTDVNGNILQKRDRQSFAILNQVSGEYRGEFGDLTFNAGIRAPFFKRDLNQYCFTTSASGFVDCFGQDATQNAIYAAKNLNAAPPQQRIYKYDKILPNVGAVYKFTPEASVFASFSQGLSVPGTDPLYNSIFFAANAPGTQPAPETTNNYELGLRYASNSVAAQLTGWYNQYNNRLSSSYDPVNEIVVFRNLGKVDKYGVDASVSFKPIPEVALYAFTSYLKSEIKDNVANGKDLAGNILFNETAGKQESGSPDFSFGGTVRGTLGPVDLGVTAKRTGSRFVNDENLAPGFTSGGVFTAVYGAKAPAYTLVNLDARINLEFLGLNDKTFLQLNVYNLFDELYVGGFGGSANQNSIPFVQIGAPRTVSGTVTVAF